MFEGEYVGYDSSINIKSYWVVGLTRRETGFEARNDVRLGSMISWPRKQLAQEVSTFGPS
jgi:hypothetical protein